MFTKDFHKHMKAMEKTYAELKYADMKEDRTKRNYVRCSKCFKKRALVAGMDYRKISKVRSYISDVIMYYRSLYAG